MTRVEELREQILGTHITLKDGTGAGMSFGKYPCVLTPQILDALISASHAEGVAEGEERERERIRNALDVTFIGGAAMTWHFDSRKWYIVPYSVLAPKEGEQDNTTEEEYEDMRRNGGPEVKT
jgi:hypothetical protein